MLDLDRDATAVGADARIDDREHHALGEVLHRPDERESTGADVERRHVVGDVDDPEMRGDIEHDGVTHADELVSTPVVREKRNEAEPGRH